MHRRAVAIVAVVTLGLVLAGCGSKDTGGTVADPGTTAAGGVTARKVEIKAANFTFEPTAVALTAGEGAQFAITNGDQTEHNLTVEGLGVDQDVEPGKTAEAPVTKALEAGTYKFHCKYHPTKMMGTVTVT